MFALNSPRVHITSARFHHVRFTTVSVSVSRANRASLSGRWVRVSLASRAYLSARAKVRSTHEVLCINSTA